MENPSIFLNEILSDVASKNASGLHLAVGSYPMIKMGNKLSPIDGEEILTEEKIDSILNDCLNQEEIKEFEKNKEIVIVKNFFDKFRFRINAFYQKNFPTLSFHYISNNIIDWDDLKITEQSRQAINFNAGLVIVTGPNNSGKSSTAASMIERINQQERKYIITLESLIERLFVSKKSIINQRQIGKDVKSYRDGLLSCLEEDVDMVYIGGLKENFEENIPLILDLAAGNCLVILEMNTKNSVRTIEKIIDSIRRKRSIESSCYMLADVLLAIFSQKIIPNNSDGLTPAFEILLVNSSVKNTIRENRIYQLEKLMDNFVDNGMTSMSKSLKKLVENGEVDLSEVEKFNIDIDI